MNRKQFLQLLSTLYVHGAAMKLNALYSVSQNLPKTEKMPVLFLGHGSPMNAIEENQFVSGFRSVAKSLPTPNAILCISAHWYTNGTKITAMEIPKTIHDFGGFPKDLYEVQYPVKGSPILARETKDLLQPIQVELNQDWGLDHGTWSVLKHLYPEANIPVIQLSIDYTKPPSYHFELAQKLNSLREKGILIIGSGNIIHNLGLIDWPHFNIDNYGHDWAIEAKHSINKYLLDENFLPLMNYHKESKAIQMAIPTPDHFLPLLYTIGLHRKGERLELFNDKLVAGSLSMTSIKIA